MSGREVFGEFNEVVLVVVQRHLIGQVRNKHPDLVKRHAAVEASFADISPWKIIAKFV